MISELPVGWTGLKWPHHCAPSLLCWRIGFWWKGVPGWTFLLLALGLLLSGEDTSSPELDADGVHLRGRAALISLDEIVATLLDRTGSTWNPARYAALRLQAPPFEGRNDHDASLWNDVGCAFRRVAMQEVAELEAGLIYHQSRPNLEARFDWAGYPRSGRPEGGTAAPESGVITRIELLLASGCVRGALHAGSPVELT